MWDVLNLLSLRGNPVNAPSNFSYKIIWLIIKPDILEKSGNAPERQSVGRHIDGQVGRRRLVCCTSKEMGKLLFGSSPDRPLVQSGAQRLQPLAQLGQALDGYLAFDRYA